MPIKVLVLIVVLVYRNADHAFVGKVAHCRHRKFGLGLEFGEVAIVVMIMVVVDTRSLETSYTLAVRGEDGSRLGSCHRLGAPEEISLHQPSWLEEDDQKLEL